MAPTKTKKRTHKPSIPEELIIVFGEVKANSLWRSGNFAYVTDEDVALAYRQRATTCHPDVGGSSDEFLRLSNAYAAIKTKSDREMLLTWYSSGKIARDNMLGLMSDIERTKDFNQGSYEATESDVLKYQRLSKAVTLAGNILSSELDTVAEALQRLDSEVYYVDLAFIEQKIKQQLSVLRQKIKNNEQGIQAMAKAMEAVDQRESVMQRTFSSLTILDPVNLKGKLFTRKMEFITSINSMEEEEKVVLLANLLIRTYYSQDPRVVVDDFEGTEINQVEYMSDGKHN